MQFLPVEVKSSLNDIRSAFTRTSEGLYIFQVEIGYIELGRNYKQHYKALF